MVLAFLLASDARACTCGPTDGVVPLVLDGQENTIPTNGVVRAHELTAGTFESEAWTLFSEADEAIPVTQKVFDQVDGSRVIELQPETALTPGKTVTLRPVGWPEGFPFRVLELTDDEAPTIAEVHFGPVEKLRNSSCGRSRIASMEVDASDNGPSPFLVQVQDLRSGLYWFGPLEWNDTCGGFPLDFWSGPKEVIVADWAGNAAASEKLHGPGGCDTAGGSRLTPPGASLLLLVGLRRRASYALRTRTATRPTIGPATS